MKKIRGIDNVFMDGASDYDFESLHEKDFLWNFIQALQEKMGVNFSDYKFVFFSALQAHKLPESLGLISKKSVLFYLSEEGSTMPYAISSNYLVIFKSYLKTDQLSDSTRNIFPFPLGYVNGINIYKPIPSKERRHNVFYSGQLNKRRIELYMTLAKLNYFPSILLSYLIRVTFIKKMIYRIFGQDFSNFFPGSYIKFTGGGFKDGLDADNYARMLYNSKLVICPSGFVSKETFRHHEAMMAGCVVISEKLPDLYFYRDSPIVQVKDWPEGIDIIGQLLDDPDRLEQLQEETVQWWKRNLSESALADYVSQKIGMISKDDF